MIQSIKRFFKFIVYSAAALFGLCVVMIIIGANFDTGTSKEDQAKIKELVKPKKEVVKVVEKPKVVKVVKVKTANEILDAKLSKFKWDIGTTCMQSIRQGAKYPNKVDFHLFKAGNKIFKNFGENTHRVLLQHGGEMMNGFGNMVPFKAKCLYEYNSQNNTYKTLEILIL